MELARLLPHGLFHSRTRNAPSEAKMVICGDYSSGIYGFLGKGCKKGLLAGLHRMALSQGIVEFDFDGT